MIERVDFYSDEEFQQAVVAEEQAYIRLQEEQKAFLEEARAQEQQFNRLPALHDESLPGKAGRLAVVAKELNVHTSEQAIALNDLRMLKVWAKRGVGREDRIIFRKSLVFDFRLRRAKASVLRLRLVAILHGYF